MSNKHELAKLQKVERSILLEEIGYKRYYYELRGGRIYLAIYNKSDVNLSLMHHPELTMENLEKIVEWYKK